MKRLLTNELTRVAVNNQPILGVDIDNVINNMQQVILQVIKKKLGKSVEPEVYDIFKKLNMNDSQKYHFLEDNWSIIMEKIQPQWRVSFFLNKLKDKYKIILITAQPYEIAEITVNWLKKYHINYDDIRFNAGDKVAACKFFKVEYMIDDSPWNLRKLNKEQVKTLIFNQPYNQNVSETEFATRVYSWDDIYQKLMLE